jgi:hypothetical protein
MAQFVAFAVLLFVAGSYGALDPQRLPLNVVVLEGQTVTLRCAAADGTLLHAVQWHEFAYSPLGSPISDNLVIGNHPQAARYEIVHGDAAEYSLRISATVLADGGLYQCLEARASVVDKYRHSLHLTVVTEPTNCTSSIGASGVVLEGSYQVNDCGIYYKGGLVPNMTWSGVGPFVQAYGSTGTLVWAGMHFNVTRDMEARAHQAVTEFTGYFLPVDGDTASNIPDYMYVHQTRQMFVYWGPRNMDATPQKPNYVPGDTLTCTADAWAPATFMWQNLRTNQITQGATVRIDEAWVGFNQSLRCEARNEIEGTTYSQNIFLPVDVPIPTTTTPPTTPTTVTLPPAVSACTDPTGGWVSISPTPASLCISVDLDNFAAVTGLLKNASDTYWVDIVGRTQIGKYDQIGFNGIWPANLGVSSFTGECHRCFGQENLLVNVVSRNHGTTCGVEGETRYTTQYHFHRSATLQCPTIPKFF